MRILFITDNFPPEVNAPATRTYEHCREWVKKGAEVTVLTCHPNFPRGSVYEGYSNRLYARETVDGIRVIRLWSYIAANEGFGRRVVDYLSFAFSAFIAGLFVKADIIVATSPQFFTTWTAFILSKLKRRPWVFELRDLWPESIESVGAMRYRGVLRLLERIELFLYSDSAMVVALTEAFRKNLVSRGIDGAKVKVVTNGANLDLFTPREKNRRIAGELGLEGKFVIGYIGTMGMAHGLEFIVKSLCGLDDRGVAFLCIGDGARKKATVSLAREMNIGNVIFLDPVPKDDIPEYLSVVDAALVPLIKSDTFKTVIPSKIFESAAMLKPILLGVEGQAREIIEEYGAGVCFEPENTADFLEKLGLLRGGNGLYGELQDGCRRLAADFDRVKLAGRMYDHLLEISRTGT